MILLTINTLACVIVFIVCGWFLMAREAKCTAQYLLQVGLLLIMVGAMTSGVAGWKHIGYLNWWMVAFRSGVACVCLVYFDRAYGIKPQLFDFLHRMNHLPSTLVRWWTDRLSIARKHANDSKR